MSSSSNPAHASFSPNFNWGPIMLQGIFATIIGLLLVASPGATITVMIQLLGIYWMISGIIMLASLFVDRFQWGWKLFAGIIGVVAGFTVLQYPLWSSLMVPSFLAVLLGIEGMIIGVVYLIQAFRGAGWGTGILGVLSILFGLVLVANPLISAAFLVFLLGFMGIVGGISTIFLAFQIRHLGVTA